MAKAKVTRRKTRATRATKQAARLHRAQQAAGPQDRDDVMPFQGQPHGAPAPKAKAQELTRTFRRAYTDVGPFKQKRDGVMPDPVQYKGNTVEFVKEISRGEEGWSPDEKMVLLQDVDGHIFRVPFSEISDLYIPPVAVTERPRRVPSKTYIGEREPR